MSLIKIIPEKTAISNGVATSARLLINEIPTSSHILDYGAGKLRNSKFLMKNGYKVSIVETKRQLEALKQDPDLSQLEHIYAVEDEIEQTFEAILCSFVLNVIPDINERSYVLQRSYYLLKDSGKLFVEVRKRRGILNSKYKYPYKDGYAIGKNEIKTFQKPFEKDEFINYVYSHGFSINHIQSTSDGWLIIAKKEQIIDE